MNTIVEKIRTKVEQRIKYLEVQEKEFLEQDCHTFVEEARVRIRELQYFLSILDTLEKECEKPTIQEQPVDWQKVAEAFTKDQPLGQDNNGNLVYPQEQPVSEGLEEEENIFANKDLNKEWKKFIEQEKKENHGDLPCYGDFGVLRIARHFAQWMREKMMKDGLNAVKSGESNMIEKTIAGVFVKYGMDRQREQMLKEAVEGYVTLTMTGTPTVAATIKEGDNIGIGDKVSVIFCKKEDGL